MLFAVFVGTYVAGGVRPALVPVSVLLVLEPVALVCGAIWMGKTTIAVSLVILPVTLIDAAVGIDQPSVPMGLAVLPVAFVEAPVRVDIGSLTVLLAFVVPFTIVDFILQTDSLLEIVGGRDRLIVEVTEFLTDFVNGILGVIVLLWVLTKLIHCFFRRVL